MYYFRGLLASLIIVLLGLPLQLAAPSSAYASKVDQTLADRLSGGGRVPALIMLAQQADTSAALERVVTHLAAERPWRDITALEADLTLLLSAYVAERRSLLQWQEQEADRARADIKAQPGFSTLTAEQAHRVLRPLAAAGTTTSDDAIAPALRELHDAFIVALKRAEDEAQATLDAILSEGEKPVIVHCDLGLKNRYLASETDLEGLFTDLRERLLPHLRTGKRVRLT